MTLDRVALINKLDCQTFLGQIAPFGLVTLQKVHAVLWKMSRLYVPVGVSYSRYNDGVWLGEREQVKSNVNRWSQGRVQADRRSLRLFLLLPFAINPETVSSTRFFPSIPHFFTFSLSFIRPRFPFPCPYSVFPSSYQPFACYLGKIFFCRCLGNRPIQSRALHCVSERKRSYQCPK